MSFFELLLHLSILQLPSTWQLERLEHASEPGKQGYHEHGHYNPVKLEVRPHQVSCYRGQRHCRYQQPCRHRGLHGITLLLVDAISAACDSVIILHGMRVFTIINGQYFKASCHYLPVHSDHSSTHSSSPRLAKYLPPFTSSCDQAQSWPDGKLSAFADPIACQVYMSVTDGTRKELPRYTE
jgi:hypothetical protein